MPTAKLGEVELYYEETGTGTPLVWSHEFGGDYRSWEPQVRYFSRRYRVVTYNHRGYPPSSVPKGAATTPRTSSWGISTGCSSTSASAPCISAAAPWAPTWRATSPSPTPRCCAASSWWAPGRDR